MATIFTIHRVEKPDSSKLHETESMKISPEFLENLIISLRNGGYDFISMDQLYHTIAQGNKKRRLIVFTIDDGYKDLVYNAYRIFRKYNVPFTAYISTSFPDKEAILWWYAIEEIILSNQEVILNSGMKFITKTTNEKNYAFRAIRKYIIDQGFIGDNFEKFLSKEFKKYKINLYKHTYTETLEWGDLKKISNDTIVTIGNHTKDHLPLNKLNKKKAYEQICESSEILQSITGNKIDHFAYPYGSRNEFGPKEAFLLKKMGYKTAVTTLYGNIYQKHINYLHSLPRIMLVNNFEMWKLGAPRKIRFQGSL